MGEGEWGPGRERAEENRRRRGGEGMMMREKGRERRGGGERETVGSGDDELQRRPYGHQTGL